MVGIADLHKLKTTLAFGRGTSIIRGRKLLFQQLARWASDGECLLAQNKETQCILLF